MSKCVYKLQQPYGLVIVIYENTKIRKYENTNYEITKYENTKYEIRKYEITKYE
jgi:hypothetical protein